MTDALESARTKLERAKLHTRIAKREAMRFFNRYPDPTFRIEPEGDEEPSYAIGSIFSCRIIVETALPELPSSFAARFGDAIHNYRCALDHIAWQLVMHGSRWPLPDEETFSVQFPIYKTLAAFEGNQGRRLPGVSGPAIDFIKARQKYVRGNATNNARLGLASLSNNDKHRALHVFLSLFRTLQSNVTFTNCIHVSWENPAERPAIKEGAVVTRFSCRVLASNPEVKMYLAPQVQIVIEDGRDVSEMLEGLSREIAEILNAPEIVAAVG